MCISILHEAKADEFNTQEKMSEKWSAMRQTASRFLRATDKLPSHHFSETEKLSRQDRVSLLRLIACVLDLFVVLFCSGARSSGLRLFSSPCSACSVTPTLNHQPTSMHR